MHYAITDRLCPDCGGGDWRVRWEVMRDGRDAYPYCCASCGYRSPIVEGHAKVRLALDRLGMCKEE